MEERTFKMQPTILIQHVLLLVDEAVDTHDASVQRGLIQFIDRTLGIFRPNVAHEGNLRALALLVNLQLARVQFADY